MSKVLGLALFITGMYFLGQDIIFTSHYYPSIWWRSIPASGSVLAMMTGIVLLIFFPRQTGRFGWMLLGFGVLLVFLSGGVILKPTSLWKFFISFVALAGGIQLMFQGRVQF
jgi:hypothetical protein